MKAGGGRQKGSKFERDAAKMVIAAFAFKGIDESDCWRTPLSGGHRQASKTDPGDLCFTRRLQKLFPYSVECKHYRKLAWHQLMRPGLLKGLWSVWWKQACDAAEKKKTGVEPLLFFRENGSPAYCMYPAYLRPGIVSTPMMRAEVNGMQVRVVLLSDFLRIEGKGHRKAA